MSGLGKFFPSGVSLGPFFFSFSLFSHFCGSVRECLGGIEDSIVTNVTSWGGSSSPSIHVETRELEVGSCDMDWGGLGQFLQD